MLTTRARLGWFPQMIGGLVLVVLLYACTTSQNTLPTPTAVSTPGLNGLAFSSADLERRITELDRCISDLAGAGWTHVPYKQIGNFYEASWCRGAGARQNCAFAESSADNRDQHAIALYTLFYPREFPQVFGLGLNVRWVPSAQGWGAGFYFSEDGKTIVGEGFGLDFFFYAAPTGKPKSTLHLGSGYGYAIRETKVQHTSGLPLREDLAQYLKSPEAMRDRGLMMLEALQAKVESTLQSHQASTCDYGPVRGNLPPICTPRPLTRAEEDQALAEAQASLGSQRQLLQDNYQELYATLLKAFPLDRCWK